MPDGSWNLESSNLSRQIMFKVYWQFKNGSIGLMDQNTRFFGIRLLYGTGKEIYHAWDRSLGGFVVYER